MLIHVNEGCKRIAVLTIDRKKGKGGGKGGKDIWRGGEEKEKNRIRQPINENNTTPKKKKKRKKEIIKFQWRPNPKNIPAEVVTENPQVAIL